MKALLPLLLASAVAGADLSSIYGDWQLGEPLASAPDTPLSGAEIESLIGVRVHYAPDAVRFGEENCEQPLFDSYTETEANFLSLFQIRFDDLRIPGQETLAVDINCMQPDVDFIAGNTVLLAGPDRLVTVVDGVFFELKRVP
jgi:hypothetical protein